MTTHTANRTRKHEKVVDVVARIDFHRADKAILYVVRSSDGASTYEVTIKDGHATGCTCRTLPDGRVVRHACYHMTQLEQRERERSTDVQQHVQDDVRTHSAEYASCYGCGQRVRHEGYCYRCA